MKRKAKLYSLITIFYVTLKIITPFLVNIPSLDAIIELKFNYQLMK